MTQKHKDVNQTFDLFQYRLETFVESRSTEWSYEPYNGEVSWPLTVPRLLLLFLIMVICCRSGGRCLRSAPSWSVGHSSNAAQFFHGRQNGRQSSVHLIREGK